MTRLPPRDFWERYASWIERRHGAILAVALLVTVLGTWRSACLELRSGFSELLPRKAPSVLELRRIEGRMEGFSTLYVTIEGGEWKARQGFAEELAAALRQQLPAGLLSHIDFKVHEARAHFERNRHLYVELADLEAIRDRLRRKIDDERERRLLFDLEDRPPLAFDLSDLERKYKAKAAEYDHFPDGYFITPDKGLQALLLRLGGAGGEEGAGHFITEVRRIVSELRPEARGYQIQLGGDAFTAWEERARIVEDLLVVSLSCILLVVLVIVLYYRSRRSLIVIAAPVAVGVAAAFGMTELTIGHLNSNTAFLGSIIVGNGINFAIIFLARYVERRRLGDALHGALRLALRQTWLGTATAALAASVAYGSLMATSFRGFSQFGFIGGIGMLLCWLATFTVGPALLVALEARWPSRTIAHKRFAPQMAGRVAGFLGRHHGSLVAAGLLLTALAIVAAASFYRDPFEYDFSKLRSRHNAEQGSAVVGAKVDTIFAGSRFSPGSPLVLLVDRPEQVGMLQRALLRKKAEGAEIERIETADSLLPVEQAPKLAVLTEIRTLLDKKVTGWMNQAQRREAEKFRPPDDLRVVGLADLPEILRRPFAEKDGRTGLMVYVYPVKGAVAFDGRRLLRFAEALRTLQLESGEVVQTSGLDLVLADILRAVVADGPPATTASLLGVLLLVGFAFRRWRARGVIAAALLVGVAWMAGVAALLELKVNMLNFVALPITFGVGVDYAVNLYRRYEHEGHGQMAEALWGTGGAVALCSLTTTIGYGSLLFADTQALNSFGLLAVLGELGTLAAALFWMPALVTWLDRRRG